MTTLPPDPWKTLGVERNADKTEIRSAYKKLVLQCHPDKVQDPALKAKKQEEFQKVQQAYELLNDDAERAKYEEKLADLQRAAKQASVKNSPNTSVPRTSTKYYDIRTTEPASRYKSHTSPSGGKIYTHYSSPHARSHEEMPSSRVHPLYEETDRQARRAASYELKRDEERRERDREERRRRKEKEEEEILASKMRAEYQRDKERERERLEKEKEREARRAEKKRVEKERKREAEDKARRHKPYVEPYVDAQVDELWAEDEIYVTSRLEKKRSSSRKHDEGRERDRDRDRERDREREREREREKSTPRRAKSPHAIAVPITERKHLENYEHATSYIARQTGSTPSVLPSFWKSQSPEKETILAPPAPPVVPTPPPAPVDLEEESIRRSSARAAGRRSSHDAAKSRDKSKYDIVDATPKARPIPTLAKSYSSPPPVAPESPPRVSRSHTTPHESYTRTVPSLGRTQTWAPGGIVDDRRGVDYYDEYYESEDDRERRHRRSRRARSPGVEPVRYKVESGKTSKLESQYSYGDSPSSARRYMAAEVVEPHSSSTTYAGVPFRVKEAKAYGPDDVSYVNYQSASYYANGGNDGYPVMA
ncbi:DnaJ-domain-containing protein [Canariomyces notabilis]|uniref:DnaJ-domain-containing protein n=1 Tax=Canariomyces notabilis TaxID=2074819 RepID=A0AAN6TI43_9PEZI|nr:DnaJ-domain-containing protein [Canariomyces arenarius]